MSRTASRTVRRLATVAASTGLAAVACVGMGATAHAATPAASATSIPQCATADLGADFQLQPNVGDRPETRGAALIMVTNNSKHTCNVRGFIGLGYVDAQGKHRDATAHRTSYVPVTTITLRPGTTAFAGANFVSQPTGCPTATAALVTPPNQTTSIATPFLSAEGGGEKQNVTLCGESFNITALAPRASDIGIFNG
ncbi:DUF4232 domain-containing protein [Streptomyces olivoreticuli]|uniref:DUF4232 domain-containing protein n=1 Tax=Streptomyces olivoreticuli TaxID=68246 RepID=UPI00265A08CF|nr:DUF4232 domain-containing protein [Streptomyces olivoreticuli]WKK21996.1 DUF4232 domain-containing protein [Streptomyces olivoreticuli]